jgi:hypothetical protein
VNIVKRSILGLEAVGVERVVIMPDTFSIGNSAIDDLRKSADPKLEASVLKMRIEGSQEDSQKAAEIMADAGVGCLITIGGDGTNRAVAKGCGRIPIAAISTGTNNVFPSMIEGTIVGMAAGLVAMGAVKPSQVCSQIKRLSIIKNQREVDSAFVDAVVCRDIFVGSKAIWDMTRVCQVVTTRGEPTNMGMSAIGGFYHPIGIHDDKGHSIEIGEGDLKIKAPISPGVVEAIRVLFKPSIIALDGEREVEVWENDDVEIRLLRDGPFIVDIEKTMNSGVETGFWSAVPGTQED